MKILFKPKRGANVSNIVRGTGGKEVGRIPQLGIIEIRVPEQAAARVVIALSKRHDVEYAELDTLEKPWLKPNDTHYSHQWYHQTIDSERAWDLANGDGVVVAILDTGIQRNHPDFVGKIVTGWNSEDYSSNYEDSNGHGTMVAGLVGSVPNNNRGITPVGWNAKLAVVKVSNFEDGSAYLSALARGVVWAADNNIPVVNMSYSGWESRTINDAALYLIEKKGVLVVAAGNSGHDYGFAKNENMIVVSATNQSNNLASWSSYGAYVDIAAPGENILTTNIGSTYSFVDGTSFSSPIVAGTVALMLSADKSLTFKKIKEILFSTTNKTTWDKYFGWGILNAGEAVARTKATVKPPTFLSFKLNFS